MTLATRPCAVCGGTSFRALYPPTVAADVDPLAFFSSSRTQAGHLAIVRCDRCDLVMTNPGDDDATLARVYAALEDRAYDAEEDNRTQVARAHLTFVARHRAPPGRLLDVGCATGTFARVACDAGWQTTGLDTSRWSIERARARCPAASFVCGAVEDACFAAASFDAVTLFDTLEHVPDPGAVLERVHGWLRPGGWLFVNLPNAASVSARLLGRHWVLLLREHLWYFSPRSFGALLQQRGFACVATRPNTVVFSLANVAARLAQYEGAAARSARAVARSPLARRVRLRFPIGEMKVAAKKLEAATPSATYRRSVPGDGRICEMGSRLGRVRSTDRPDPEQMQVLARLSPQQKLAVVERLREEALALKEAWLRDQHPGDDDATIQRRLRGWQIHGSARLD